MGKYSINIVEIAKKQKLNVERNQEITLLVSPIITLMKKGILSFSEAITRVSELAKSQEELILLVMMCQKTFTEEEMINKFDDLLKEKE